MKWKIKWNYEHFSFVTLLSCITHRRKHANVKCWCNQNFVNSWEAFDYDKLHLCRFPWLEMHLFEQIWSLLRCFSLFFTKKSNMSRFITSDPTPHIRIVGSFFTHHVLHLSWVHPTNGYVVTTTAKTNINLTVNYISWVRTMVLREKTAFQFHLLFIPQLSEYDKIKTLQGEEMYADINNF